MILNQNQDLSQVLGHRLNLFGKLTTKVSVYYQNGLKVVIQSPAL